MKANVKISSKLLKEFDEVLHDRGYKSRSKGMRDALKDYILRYQEINEIESERIGIITVTYDYHSVGVMADLTSVQHEYREHINAVMHINMTEKQCMDVIDVRGDVNYIRDLTEKIMHLRGVKHVKLTSIGIKEK